MFGYATDETEECMPLTIVLAHALNERLAICRRDGTLPWARPDSKSQVCSKCHKLFFILHIILKYFTILFNLSYQITDSDD